MTLTGSEIMAFYQYCIHCSSVCFRLRQFFVRDMQIFAAKLCPMSDFLSFNFPGQILRIRACTAQKRPKVPPTTSTNQHIIIANQYIIC